MNLYDYIDQENKSGDKEKQAEILRKVIRGEIATSITIIPPTPSISDFSNTAFFARAYVSTANAPHEVSPLTIREYRKSLKNMAQGGALDNNLLEAIKVTSVVESTTAVNAEIAPPIQADTAQAEVEAVPITQGDSTTQKTVSNARKKLNRNELDPAIDEAIKLAGNMELADVFLKLKDLAISEFKPFTGVIEGTSLCYTNSNDNSDKFSKNALQKRLKIRRRNAT